jgi:hypothetical protein
MKKFEVGHVYFDQYACDHETLTTIKIIKRTAKTVTFERNGKTRRAKLYENADGEYIIPDHYSMAPVYRAERELLDEEPEQPAAADNTIRFPQAPAAGYSVAGLLVDYTMREMVLSIFDKSDLRAKELDFLAALTDRASSVAR